MRHFHTVPNPLKKEGIKVFKHENLNRALFPQKWTQNYYKVYLLIIAKIAQKNFYQKNAQKYESTHILKVKEFSSMFNIPQNLCYKLLEKSVDQLLYSRIVLKKIDESTVLKVVLCSWAEYDKKNGCIILELNRAIIPYIKTDANKYSLYLLNDIKNFKSLYTIRIFELLQGFMYTGWVIYSVSELRMLFDAESKLKKYTDFRKRTFGKATEEINKIHPQMKLSFTEIKEGRNVVKIKFSFAVQKRNIEKCSSDL